MFSISISFLLLVDFLAPSLLYLLYLIQFCYLLPLIAGKLNFSSLAIEDQHLAELGKKFKTT
jgi:hypothetical protein